LGIQPSADALRSTDVDSLRTSLSCSRQLVRDNVDPISAVALHDRGGENDISAVPCWNSPSCADRVHRTAVTLRHGFPAADDFSECRASPRHERPDLIVQLRSVDSYRSQNKAPERRTGRRSDVHFDLLGRLVTAGWHCERDDVRRRCFLGSTRVGRSHRPAGRRRGTCWVPDDERRTDGNQRQHGSAEHHQVLRHDTSNWKARRQRQARYKIGSTVNN